MTKSNNDATAWSEFWANNSQGKGGGCLPQRWAEIETAQKAAWHGIIADLPQGANVLDLATGDGRILRWMREKRSDLTLMGVDLAPQVPPAPDGTETRGGVAMEDLPFDTDSFDAVVSQFGFEYGDVAASAVEIANVLKPGGTVGLMVHRGDGPILEHNLKRRAAIDWALSEKQVIAVLKNALTAPEGGIKVAAQVMAALAMLGARAHGQESPAWEIPEALRRAVLLGAKAGAEDILESAQSIEAQATNEIGRIASLERACGIADARDALHAAMQKAGLSLKSTETVNQPGGRAIADFLIFN
jgi:SAM-dependent methyltransferase